MLAEIGAVELPIELVLNKIDRVDEVGRRRLANRFPGAPQVSAETGEGLDELEARIAERFAGRLEAVRLLVPYEEGARLSELYALGAPIEQREDTADGRAVVARLPRRELPRFAPYPDRRGGTSGRRPDRARRSSGLRPDAVMPGRAYAGDAGPRPLRVRAASSSNRASGRSSDRPRGGDSGRATPASSSRVPGSRPSTASRS